MPRVSREQSERNRQAIEEVSARLFREHGFRGVSVEHLMAAAGLTHGGFYGHFDSKDELTAIACSKAFDQSQQSWSRRIDEAVDRRSAYAQIVSQYLSTRQRDESAKGCPLASFAVDVAREAEDKPVRRAFLEGVKGLADTLTGLLGKRRARSAREQALAHLATLVGALALARATRGDPISDEFLQSARQELLDDARSFG
jgi:TetR/AcrR family transcriptional repressor of nem operon